ncbi:MAG TPA: glycerate kinase [Aldersonia sp.]
MMSTDQKLRVVIAPDSFKGSLDATSVAAAIADGWASRRPDDDLILLPQADGGEGTLDAVAASHPDARWRAIENVHGPDGRPTTGRWLCLPDGTAAVELAQVNGLPMMATLDPEGASTVGLGQVIAAALHDGAKALVIGLGGSASTDGGAGALCALGARLLDRDGRELSPGGSALRNLATVDLTGLRRLPPGGVTLLTDTTAVLCGRNGAAHVFGPQKGADATTCARLDEALARFSRHLTGCDPDLPGTGAAGGAAFGLTTWGATIAPGAHHIAELTGLAGELATADIVVTGEGRFDTTSLKGKLVGSILQRCARTGTRPIVVAGAFAATPPAGSVALADLAGSVRAARRHPARWARAAGAAAAALEAR